MWDDTTDFRSSQNEEGFRLIDYEDGLGAEPSETFSAQRTKVNHHHKSRQSKTNKNHRTMNGQGAETSAGASAVATTSHMTSVLSGEGGRHAVERYPSYSSDIEAGNISFTGDGKALLNVDTEENIKFAVSSALFVAIIILVFVMMFTFNPSE